MLAEKVSKASELPVECTKYPEAVKAASVQRTPTKSAYEGMTGGLAAQANKAKGRESQAQIQRRLTNSRRFTKQS
jgi:ribose 1,5-bisphosphokinase PhnN